MRRARQAIAGIPDDLSSVGPSLSSIGQARVGSFGVGRRSLGVGGRITRDGSIQYSSIYSGIEIRSCVAFRARVHHIRSGSNFDWNPNLSKWTECGAREEHEISRARIECGKVDDPADDAHAAAQRQ
jgi:hypothetical protein